MGTFDNWNAINSMSTSPRPESIHAYVRLCMNMPLLKGSKSKEGVCVRVCVSD